LKDSVMMNSILSASRIKQRNKVAGKKKYWLRLDNTCNNNCIFCLDSELHDGTFRDVADIKKDIKKGVREGAVKLIVSGGEPTVHLNFLEIVSLARKNGYKEIQVISNGRMFCYPEFLKEAVNNGVTEITFSIHAHTQRLYEAISGVKGSYRQVLRGLVNALGVKGLVVNIDIVLNKINYKYLEQILRFFIDLGVTEFDLLQVVPFGAAWKNRKKVFYNLDKALPYLKKAFRLQFEFPNIYIWTNRFPPQYLEGFEELIQHPVKLYDEIRGRKVIFRRFVNGHKVMSCFGLRCRRCFLERFCADLIELKKRGALPARRRSFCLGGAGGHPGKFEAGGKIDPEFFLRFYIKHRYFLKSLRCGDCRYFDKCDGAPIDLLRNKGFKVLKPIRIDKNKQERMSRKKGLTPERGTKYNLRVNKPK